LNSFNENEVDGITEMVARNTEQFAQFSGIDVTTKESPTESYIRLYYKQQYMARIIEGCNAISVVILFVSFVASFLGRLKSTLLFIFGGSLLVYFLNIIRIAMLSVLMYHFPEYQHFLHGVVFPLFIYGVVFLLWVLWVIKFSSYVNNAAQT
jgi:exosortase family protein XrtF